MATEVVMTLTTSMFVNLYFYVLGLISSFFGWMVITNETLELGMYKIFT